VGDAQILVQACGLCGGRDDDEALRVCPFEDDLAGRATDSARDCLEHGVDGASGIHRDRPYLFDSEARQGLSDCRSPCVKGEGKMGTHARVPYASVTMPCFAENSKTSFHDA
jgi:hypothetical protein